MAAIQVTLSGMLYDRLARTTQNVVFMGDASLTGIGIGGGPIVPPEGGQPPDPNAPRPSHPIAKPGDPWWGGDLHPAHPIELPPEVPPDIPAPPDLFTWKVAWTEETGWVVVAVPNVPHPVPSKK